MASLTFEIKNSFFGCSKFYFSVLINLQIFSVVETTIFRLVMMTKTISNDATILFINIIN